METCVETDGVLEIEITARRDLVFYAQSTIAVISGRTARREGRL